MSKNSIPDGVKEVDLSQWDVHGDEDVAYVPTSSAYDSISEKESFVQIEISSDSEDSATVNNTQKENKNHSNSHSSKSEEEVIIDDISTTSSITQQKEILIAIDDPRINLLPAKLREPIRNIIKKINRWAKRNQTGVSFSALEILYEKVDEFLELQKIREDSDYELQCRNLLSLIYQNTIETQRIVRKLRDEATPRSLDEYESNIRSRK
ncbi:hypothetical protein GPJ56_003383 [Histomonas meleagridis]|uniref:uncharacterized protein n=1 Tax=Histomonas meleagridis TaxID=135588 RepID=UPI00355A623C|nr:hypothetical protein GPJ56_003383 [Histomonas meleagridis]KAH0805002.1 hypothetical protein GO595_001947 [Histomonas meleagridis]